MPTKASIERTANEVFETVEDQVGRFAGKAYETGRAQAEAVVDEQRNAFKNFCMTIVRALRRGGDELRDEGYATVAGMVDDVATKAEEMTTNVDDLDMRSATQRVEDFVREKPLVAYGALAIAGFLVANTLQSAAQHRQQRNIAAPRPASTRQPQSRTPRGSASAKSVGTTTRRRTAKSTA
jgi:ElaB/YqjD/DUF883 family membrane-anchored ribosome-binding protein